MLSNLGLGRKSLVILSLLLIAVFMASQIQVFAAVSEDNETANIPDWHLRQAINRQLGMPDSAYPTIGDLRQLQTLARTNGSSISSIEGLQYATNLKHLDLGRNPDIKDFTILSHLTGLEELYLDADTIADLSPLSNLTHLRYLSLGGVQSVIDLRPIGGLAGLEVLVLDNGVVSDISPLAGMTNLIGLSLFKNLISDLTPVTQLPHLKELKVGSNRIKSLPDLSAMTSLETLELNNNQLTAITQRVDVPSLKHLWLNNNAIEDLGALTHFPNLLNLALSHNGVKEIAPLAGLNHLEGLWLDDNQIGALKPLPPSLTYLDLSHNQIADLTPLATLSHLENLQLTYNQITDITPLRPMATWDGAPRQKFLNLDHNDLPYDAIRTWGVDPYVFTVNFGTQSEDTAPEPQTPPPIQSFNDLDGHWAKGTIARLAALQMVGGYADGTFKPDHPITRTEVAALLARMLKLPWTENKSDAILRTRFADAAQIPYWARDPVATVVAEGLISGYPQPNGTKTFEAEKFISRAELAAILSRIVVAKLGSVPLTDHVFADEAQLPEWAKGAIAIADTRHLVGGYPDNTFRADQQVTRAEASSMLLRLYDLIQVAP